MNEDKKPKRIRNVSHFHVDDDSHASVQLIIKKLLPAEYPIKPSCVIRECIRFVGEGIALNNPSEVEVVCYNVGDGTPQHNRMKIYPTQKHSTAALVKNNVEDIKSIEFAKSVEVDDNAAWERDEVYTIILNGGQINAIKALGLMIRETSISMTEIINIAIYEAAKARKTAEN